MDQKLRAFVRVSVLFSLLAGPFVSAASAASTIVAYSYSGKLTQVSTQAGSTLGLAVGDYITGTFSYDSALPGIAGVYTYTGSSKAHTFSFTIFDPTGKTQLFTDKYSGNVTAYFANNVVYNTTANGGTHLSMLGDTIYKSALGISGPSNPAFDLTLNNPTNAGGFTPSNLPNPNPTVVKSFVSTSGLLDWDPNNLRFQAQITQFKPGLQGVPEPSSLVMAGISFTTCAAGFWFARRKRARWRSERLKRVMPGAGIAMRSGGDLRIGKLSIR